ncbi:MAG: acyltransferase [Pseudomonas sp.]|uniref:acyltransferase family protein n=1 Tax=Pseudomonas sp. TaxID=306 RepID=UPI003242046A
MRYSPQLDGIRAVAATLVLFGHMGVPGFSGGFLGVDVFFVLSGYLITQILVDEHAGSGRIAYRDFVVRRFYRLYPALLGLVGVYLLIAPVVFARWDIVKHLQDAALALVYMTDYAKPMGAPMAVLNQTWSLGVEEKFYLLWPLALPLILKLPRATAIKLLACAFVLATEWRAVAMMFVDNHWSIYNRFDTHCTGLILGSLMGLAKPRLPAYVGHIGVAGLAGCVYLSTWRDPSVILLGFTAAELFSAMVICAPPAVLGKGILPWLGKMSYGFYLWHYLIFRAAGENGIEFWPRFGLVAFGGLACAALSYYTIEAPLRAKNRSRHAMRKALPGA